MKLTILLQLVDKLQQIGKIDKLQQVCAFLAVYPPNDMDNDFRQMSVLSQLAKVLQIIQQKSNKEDLNQHAFTHGGSTVTALASQYHSKLV